MSTGAAPAEVTVEQVIRQRVSDALGGWYGSLETALPTIAFVLTWVVFDDVRTAVAAAAVLLVVLAVVRHFVGGGWRYLGSAVLATALAAFFALRSGQAEDAFLPGIITSAAYGVAAVVSILVRWPLVGFIVAIGDPEFAERPAQWRRDKGLVRVCSRLTWVLVALFALRVAIMLPLYLAAEVAWLGAAKVALGWPAYLLAIVVMGLMLAKGRTPQTDDGPDDVTERMLAAHLEHEGEHPAEGGRPS
ncbi:hypothetical protein GCM10009584_21290 [Ornithinimicrobium humiphilum]|uniref:Uncharacterized protein DUF3159 n=1 Tax=Ornithinimicrobium humiphilum TaxID=125288 RepID=A0A543KNC4_9MICO|nr:DUF3159 domain-containing protein [Ornithinimicrobium humiphilum]TQM96576.1 uncharacterized protein DUF3159 [Ornithinimicrobium humiphilum]